MAGKDTITPTQGSMTADEHTAFIMRIMMHLAAIAPGGVLEVDLNDVARTTQGIELRVELDGPSFKAVAVKSIIHPENMLN